MYTVWADLYNFISSILSKNDQKKQKKRYHPHLYRWGVLTGIKNKLGEDRAKVIKEAILTAMLWAEEELGIGNGDRKWDIAWEKLIELLKDKNIRLKKSEEKVAKTMMKAKVSEVNQQKYDVLLKRKKLKN